MIHHCKLVQEIDFLSTLYKTISASNMVSKTEIFEDAKNQKYMNYTKIIDEKNNIIKIIGHIDYELATYSVNILLQKIYIFFLHKQNINKLDDFFRFYDFISSHPYMISFCSFILKKSRIFFENKSKQSSLFDYINQLSNGIIQRNKKNTYISLQYNVSEITYMINNIKL